MGVSFTSNRGEARTSRVGRNSVVHVAAEAATDDASQRDIVVATNQKATMVRVFYEPPPGGPRSNLNRGAYYVESAMEPMWIKRLQKMRPVTVIVPAVGFFACLCYLPLSKSPNVDR